MIEAVEAAELTPQVEVRGEGARGTPSGTDSSLEYSLEGGGPWRAELLENSAGSSDPAQKVNGKPRVPLLDSTLRFQNLGDGENDGDSKEENAAECEIEPEELLQAHEERRRGNQNAEVRPGEGKEEYERQRSLRSSEKLVKDLAARLLQRSWKRLRPRNSMPAGRFWSMPHLDSSTRPAAAPRDGGDIAGETAKGFVPRSKSDVSNHVKPFAPGKCVRSTELHDRFAALAVQSAAHTIQSWARKCLARCAWREKVLLESLLRQASPGDTLDEQLKSQAAKNTSAARIQAAWRGHIVRCSTAEKLCDHLVDQHLAQLEREALAVAESISVDETGDAAVAVQCAYRQKLARSRLRKAKMLDKLANLGYSVQRRHKTAAFSQWRNVMLDDSSEDVDCMKFQVQVHQVVKPPAPEDAKDGDGSFTLHGRSLTEHLMTQFRKVDTTSQKEPMLPEDMLVEAQARARERVLRIMFFRPVEVAAIVDALGIGSINPEIDPFDRSEIATIALPLPPAPRPNQDAQPGGRLYTDESPSAVFDDDELFLHISSALRSTVLRLGLCTVRDVVKAKRANLKSEGKCAARHLLHLATGPTSAAHFVSRNPDPRLWGKAEARDFLRHIEAPVEVFEKAKPRFDAPWLLGLVNPRPQRSRQLNERSVRVELDQERVKDGLSRLLRDCSALLHGRIRYWIAVAQEMSHLHVQKARLLSSSSAWHRPDVLRSSRSYQAPSTQPKSSTTAVKHRSESDEPKMKFAPSPPPRSQRLNDIGGKGNSSSGRRVLRSSRNGGRRERSGRRDRKRRVSPNVNSPHETNGEMARAQSSTNASDADAEKANVVDNDDNVNDHQWLRRRHDTGFPKDVEVSRKPNTTKIGTTGRKPHSARADRVGHKRRGGHSRDYNVLGQTAGALRSIRPGSLFWVAPAEEVEEMLTSTRRAFLVGLNSAPATGGIARLARKLGGTKVRATDPVEVKNGCFSVCPEIPGEDSQKKETYMIPLRAAYYVDGSSSADDCSEWNVLTGWLPRGDLHSGAQVVLAPGPFLYSCALALGWYSPEAAGVSPAPTTLNTLGGQTVEVVRGISEHWNANALPECFQSSVGVKTADGQCEIVPSGSVRCLAKAPDETQPRKEASPRGVQEGRSTARVEDTRTKSTKNGVHGRSSRPSSPETPDFEDSFLNPLGISTADMNDDPPVSFQVNMDRPDLESSWVKPSANRYASQGIAVEADDLDDQPRSLRPTSSAPRDASRGPVTGAWGGDLSRPRFRPQSRRKARERSSPVNLVAVGRKMMPDPETTAPQDAFLNSQPLPDDRESEFPAVEKPPLRSLTYDSEAANPRPREEGSRQHYSWMTREQRFEAQLARERKSRTAKAALSGAWEQVNESRSPRASSPQDVEEPRSRYRASEVEGRLDAEAERQLRGRLRNIQKRMKARQHELKKMISASKTLLGRGRQRGPKPTTATKHRSQNAWGDEEILVRDSPSDDERLLEDTKQIMDFRDANIGAWSPPVGRYPREKDGGREKQQTGPPNSRVSSPMERHPERHDDGHLR